MYPKKQNVVLQYQSKKGPPFFCSKCRNFFYFFLQIQKKFLQIFFIKLKNVPHKFLIKICMTVLHRNFFQKVLKFLPIKNFFLFFLFLSSRQKFLGTSFDWYCKWDKAKCINWSFSRFILAMYWEMCDFVAILHIWHFLNDGNI